MKDKRTFFAEGVCGDGAIELEGEALRLAQEAFTGEDVTLVVVPEYTIRRNTGVWPAPDDPNYKSFRANIMVKVWTGDDEEQEESQE